jgi:hypothetical protein
MRCQKLARFGHPPVVENDGMLDYWNNGCTARHHLEKAGDSSDLPAIALDTVS